MMAWYGRLGTAEKVVAALAILAATVALSVTSIGLWLILFSVKLPLWIAAAATALGRMVWTSVSKMAFKAVLTGQVNPLASSLNRAIWSNSHWAIPAQAWTASTQRQDR